VRTVVFLIALGLLPGIVTAQDSQEPLESGAIEEVKVVLVMVETLVLDGKGRTVPDLTEEDFVLTVQGRAREIDEFDVSCPAGAAEEPTELDPKNPRKPVVPDLDRKIVLLVDYYHLGTIDRTDVLNQAMAMVHYGKTRGEQIMVAALANGLRVEQRFTRDADAVLRTLERMEHDASLFAMDFGSITDRPFFDNLGTLMDVLAEYDGTKAVVMFSNWMATSADWDLQFWDVAERAALSRTVVYPVWAAGLQAGGPTGGSPSLARLANESGGRFTRNTSDLSVAYARAQRDLACRYAVGFYVDPDTATSRRTIRVRVKDGAGEIKYPEMFKVFSEEERRSSRMRAAFADPERFEDPLVRLSVFPMRPRSAKDWDAVVALQLPLPSRSEGVTLDVGLTLARGTTQLKDFRREVRIDDAESDSGSRQVTLYGHGSLKPGTYSLKAAIAYPGDDQIQTTEASVAVPAVPDEGLFLRGPVLLRIDPDGIRMQVGKKKVEERGAIDDILGPRGTVEPLVVRQAESDDDVLAVLEACTVDRDFIAGGSRILRSISVRGGEEVHRFDPVTLELPGKKGKPRCQDLVDRIPPGTLEPGRYQLDVVVEPASGEEPLARARVPFMVK
jgi:VWFA-related protein